MVSINFFNHLKPRRVEFFTQMILIPYDTHMEELVLLNSLQKLIETQGWLLLTFLICLYNQLSSFDSIVVQISEKRDSSNRQLNEWLLLSVTFTAKLELILVLIFEKTFS